MDVITQASSAQMRWKFAALPATASLDLWQALLAAADQFNIPYSLREASLGTNLLPEPEAISDLHLICCGRVRLLCQPGQLQPGQLQPGQLQPAQPGRAVTALLLSENETFGAEALLSLPALPYQAVAATAVQIARIRADGLPELLNRFPDWQMLQQQAQLRERMIFFRSCREGESLSSQRSQPFVSAWTAEQIPAGAILAEATVASEGRYWLRQGSLQSRDDRDDRATWATAAGPDSEPEAAPTALSATDSERANLPQVGESWGYPDAISPNWVAQTDLMLYRMPAEHWENLSLLCSSRDSLADSPTDSAAGPTISTRTRAASGSMLSVSANLASANLAVSPAAPSERTLKPEPSAVIFPKPIKRHLLDFLDRYPWIEQHSSSDCGAACLGMIAQYWGKRFPLHLLRERANIGRSGASLKSLAKAAESLGFHARPVRASFSRLVNQANPWIAHWQGNHYVAVYQTKGNRVILADPARGRRVVSRQEFQTHWSGYALLLDPTEALQAAPIKQASLNRYLSALVPYGGLSAQIILISLLIQLFSLVTPLFTQIILDQVVVQKSQPMLNAFAAGLVLFGIWGICMGSMRQYLLSYFSNRLDLTLLSGFIRHALTLPLKFFEARRVGDILTRVQENQKIQRFLIGQVLLAWLDFLTGFIYLALMLYYNWRLTLLVLLLIPPIVTLTLVSTPFLRRISRQIFHEASDQNSSLVEMMTGIATVKSAAAERELRWRWEDHLTRQMNAVFRGQKLGIGLQFTSGLINSLGGAALLWYGATLVIQDQLTIGQFVAFNMMMGYVISPVITLVNLWDELQEVSIAIERLNDVFETPPEEKPQHELLTLPVLRGEVQFADVSFRYGEDEEQNTLQNLSLEIQCGQTIAIVGRSGSGKTTLVKLIQGLYFANRGRVCVDGHDLRHVSLYSLRSQIGVVPQECFLFSGTILDNITLYRPEYSLEQVIEVAKLAEAHAFIQSLPLGYSTIVGERGSTLSGGQRQRLAIARALLGDPRILILDEATSSLDTESERRFQRNLAQISQNRTTFIIAHRLSTVRNADRILVLDRGVLVEQGTHSELMALQGLYSHLAQQQLDL